MTDVVVVPVGFVSDHLEVQWDLDVEAAAVAAELGLGFTRTPTPGPDPRFVAMVRELVEERLDPNRPKRALSPSARPTTSARSTAAGFVSLPSWCSEGDLLWTPSPDRVATSRFTDFTRWVEAERGLTFGSYEELQRWSAADLEGFWSALAEWVGIRWSTPPDGCSTAGRCPVRGGSRAGG